MVTGSHNPPSYNGFKLVLEKAPFFGADIQALGTLAASADYASGRGSVGSLSVFDAYVDSLLASVAGRRSLKAAWAAGNGAKGEVLAAVARPEEARFGEEGASPGRHHGCRNH